MYSPGVTQTIGSIHTQRTRTCQSYSDWNVYGGMCQHRRTFAFKPLSLNRTPLFYAEHLPDKPSFHRCSHVPQPCTTSTRCAHIVLHRVPERNFANRSLACFPKWNPLFSRHEFCLMYCCSKKNLLITIKELLTQRSLFSSHLFLLCSQNRPTQWNFNGINFRRERL